MQLDDLLRNAAERFRDRPALCCDGVRVSFGEFNRDANRLANALIEAGLRKGDRCAVFLENRVEAAVSIFGILRAGCAFVPINPTMKPDKLFRILRDCEARGLILADRALASVSAIDEEAPSIACLIACGAAPSTTDGHSPSITLHYGRDLPSFPSTPPPQRLAGADMAAIVYTSGTTGQPKGVVFSHDNLLCATDSISEYLGNTPDDVIVNVLPVSFTYGLSQILTAAKSGACVVLERSFAYPYQVVKRIEHEHVTGFPGVPTMFATLLQMKDLAPASFDSVRYLTNAGAALPPAHIPRLRALFRNARIFLMYGQTECVRATYLPPDEIDRRPTSVGRGMPNVQLSVIDPNGNPVPPGQKGQLVVKGGNVMQGYWNLPAETERALRPGQSPGEKILHTGDVFTTDEEGYLYFVARNDDIIKSRGEKISPREVEHVICELPAVHEVAVLGVPDPILGEAVKAVVVKAPDAQLTKKQILGHCRNRLEPFMVPKWIEFRPSLPKTMTGKILKSELADDHPGGSGDRI